jgi:hypothetical protein
MEIHIKQKNKTMKPIFYGLVPIADVLSYTNQPEGTMLEERLPNNCECDVCGKNEWIVMPKEKGQKQYIMCLACSSYTHL